MTDYVGARKEFYRRKLLPVNHPEKIKSMFGWLKVYNLLDVQPLAFAIEKCFRTYSQNFNVNPMLSQSLPSLAQEAMFKNFDPESPLFFSFPDKFKDISKLFRENVIGGLVNVFLRHGTTISDPSVPHSATHTPNGDKITNICGLDFNGMYVKAQEYELPTSPGILWETKGNFGWNKKAMAYGTSFKAQQWLTLMQSIDPRLDNEDGTRSIIHTKFQLGFR